MNNIESMVDILSKMREDLKANADRLNTSLEACQLNTINLDQILRNIQIQIESAQSKFTIAFVGTFKTGKSTIINSLLELTGDARLSSEYDPDTAKCIRLVYKEKKSPEAEVEFVDTYKTEQLSWKEAKKYTSQVELDKADDRFREKAAKIREVRYYVKHELLKLCNILDLPGTGTGNYAEHTAVTDEKIMETDCFFWVVTTECEPDMETVRNLEKVRHKLLPIINVWQIEADDIGMESDRLTPDDILDLLNRNYSAYMVNAEDPVIYYAGEIDYAQRHGYEVRPEWGKERFVEKVMQLLENIHDGDRGSRIHSNLTRALDQCEHILNELQNAQALKLQERDNKEAHHEAEAQRIRFEKCRNFVRSEIEERAQMATNEVLGILSDATENFVYTKMDSLDLRALLKGKKRYAEELKAEYENNYICLQDGWVEDCGHQYFEAVHRIIKGNYVDLAFSVESEAEEQVFDVNKVSLSEFVDGIADALVRDAAVKLLPALLSAVISVISLYIPGGAIADTLYALLAGKNTMDLTDNSMILAKSKLIANSCKVRIRQQKYTILREYTRMGISAANQMASEIEAKVNQHQAEVKQQKKMLHTVRQNINAFMADLAMQKREIDGLFRVKG